MLKLSSASPFYVGKLLLMNLRKCLTLHIWTHSKSFLTEHLPVTSRAVVTIDLAMSIGSSLTFIGKLDRKAVVSAFPERTCSWRYLAYSSPSVSCSSHHCFSRVHDVYPSLTSSRSIGNIQESCISTRHSLQPLVFTFGSANSQPGGPSASYKFVRFDMTLPRPL